MKIPHPHPSAAIDQTLHGATSSGANSHGKSTPDQFLSRAVDWSKSLDLVIQSNGYQILNIGLGAGVISGYVVALRLLQMRST